MHKPTVNAHAGLTAFAARIKGDQPGPAHAALAVSIAHQLQGLVQLVEACAASSGRNKELGQPPAL